MILRSGFSFNAWLAGAVVTALTMGHPATPAAADEPKTDSSLQHQIAQFFATGETDASEVDSRVRLVADDSAEAAAPRSEIQRQLDLLYARDGQQAPEMTFDALADQSAGMQRTQITRNPVNTTAPPPQPAAKPAKQNPIAAFFRKLTGRDKPQRRSAQPVTAPVPAGGQPGVANQPRLLPEAGDPAATTGSEFVRPIPLDREISPFSEVSETKADSPADDQLILEPEDSAPSIAAKAANQIQQRTQLPQITPGPPSQTTPDESVPAARQQAPAAARHGDKWERLASRRDLSGLKGFCPVTLRDERDLVDARPEFQSTFRGQRFHFASQAAKAKFDENPAHYAPASFGADLVALVRDEQVVEGSLEHAVWFRGRLYLFDNPETLQAFAAAPAEYAAQEPAQ